jgi:hypothetical protein
MMQAPRVEVRVDVLVPRLREQLGRKPRQQRIAALRVTND